MNKKESLLLTKWVQGGLGWHTKYLGHTLLVTRRTVCVEGRWRYRYDPSIDGRPCLVHGLKSLGTAKGVALAEAEGV